MEGNSLTEALRETLDVFDGVGEPHSTSEIAKELDLSRRGAYARLDRLVEHDQLETKKIGASARVWWRPHPLSNRAALNGPIRDKAENSDESTTDPDKSHQQMSTDQTSREQNFTQQVLETIPVGVLTIEPDGTFTTANRRAVELLDLKRTSDGTYTVGIKDVYTEDGEYLPPDGRPYIQAFEDGEPVRNWQGRIELSNSGTRWLSTNIEPLTDNSGTVKQILVTIEDISKLKEQAEQLERRQEELESELDEILDRVTDAVYGLDEQWRFTYLNDRAHDVLNPEGRELVGKSIWEAFPDTVETEFEVQYRWAMETQQAVSFEEYSPTPLNAWFKVNVYPSETGLSVYLHDITEQKEQQQELERYVSIIDAIGDPVYEVDTDGHLTFINEAFVDRFGYEESEVLGQHISLGIDDEDIAEVETTINHLASNGGDETAAIEFDVQTKDGEQIPVEARLSVLTDESQLRGSAGMLLDISGRKEREQALEESEQRYRALVENFPDGAVGLFDGELQYTAAGGELLDQLGLSSDDAIGDSIYERYPDDIVAQIEPHFQAALNGERSSVEVEYYGRDLFAHLLPLDDEGGASGMLLVQDITERKEREREFERQHEQLAALNSLNEVVRDVTETVIDRSTREEIEQAVCDALAAADAYEFAWLAHVDSATNMFEPGASAGTQGYANEITVSLDPDDPGSDGPGARAIREQEIQVVQDVFSDPSFEPWREAAAEYGFSAAASIPIVHEGTVYGVLAIYTDRPKAFAHPEKQIVSQLGEVVGHAIAAADRKQALMSDELVALEFRIMDVFESFDHPVEPEGPITFDSMIPLDDDEALVYGTISGDAADTLSDLVDAIPHWESVTIRSRGDPTKFELRTINHPILSVVSSLGGSIEQAVIEKGDYRMTIHLAPSVDVRQVIEAVEAVYPQVEVLRRQQFTRVRDDSQRIQHHLMVDLTERQRTALEAAYQAGFFEWPRDADGTEVAASLGVSPATFHQHLRIAERKIFDVLELSTAETTG